MHYGVTIFLLMVLAATAWADEDTITRRDVNDAISAYADAVALDHIPEAYLYARDAYKLGRKLLAEDPAELAPLVLHYGRAAATWQQREANIILEEAVALYQAVYGETSREMIEPLIDLGTEAARRQDGVQAYESFRQAADIAHSNFPAGSFLEGRALMGIGLLHRDAGDLARALEQTRRATSYLAHHGDASDWQIVADAFYAHGDIAWHDQNIDSAELAYEKALALYLKNRALAMRVLSLRQRLIATADARGDFAKAAFHCEQYGLRRPFERGWPIYVPPRLAGHYQTEGNRRASAVAHYSVLPSGRATDVEITSAERVTPEQARILFEGSYFVPQVENGRAVSAAFSPPERPFPLPGELKGK